MKKVKVNANMHMSDLGVQMLMKLEGLKDGDISTPQLEPYVCPSGFWTIGFGHLCLNMGERMHVNSYNEKEVKKMIVPLENKNEASKLLIMDLVRFERHIINCFNVVLSQAQFDALVLFSYNCWYSKTLFKMINRNDSFLDIQVWWSTHWITCNRIINKGLVKRRAIESILFASGEYYL